jgi:hypothetical protein
MSLALPRVQLFDCHFEAGVARASRQIALIQLGNLCWVIYVPAIGSTKSSSTVTALWRCAAAVRRVCYLGTKKTWAKNSQK